MAALGIRLPDDGNRLLGFALATSIALHVALLLALPMLREVQRFQMDARNPIVARLLEPLPKPAPAVAPPAVAPESSKWVAAPVLAQPFRPRAKPVPKPIAAAKPDNAEPERDAIESPPQSQAAPMANIAPAAEAQPSTVDPRPVPPVASAPDEGTLAQYRVALISAAKRYKRYPRLALENNWQGKVAVRLAIGADGAISGLVVRSSAGHAPLDQQALDMIERAQAVSPIPPALRGKEFSVDIPVEFSLREPGV